MRAARTSVAEGNPWTVQLALQELVSMGVENIITFDAHDSRVQNATPLHGFETVQPVLSVYQGSSEDMKKVFILIMTIIMIISPDEGSMNRAIYLANILWCRYGYVL